MVDMDCHSYRLCFVLCACLTRLLHGYSGVTWNGYLYTLLILAVDKCLSTLHHMFIEVPIVVDRFMSVSIAPSHLSYSLHQLLLYACGWNKFKV